MMNTADRIYAKVSAYMKQQQMLMEDDIVLAGVSGGSDSICMLYLLDQYRKTVPFRLHVIHVHHGIRGEEADRDCHFVEEICRELTIPLTIVRRQVPELARKWKVSEEEAGRIVRQTAFKEEAARLAKESASEKKGGLQDLNEDKDEKDTLRDPYERLPVRIALAHNQNDLAETVLHHLARGTGLAGLSSMRPVSGRIVRPLLILDKQEILSYLEARGLAYKEDSTNHLDEYTRNRIRHHLIPLMEEINENAVRHIAAASEMAGEAGDYLLEKGRNIVRFDAGKRTCLLDDHFFQAHPLERKYGVLWALSALTAARKDLGSVHVEQILALYNRQTGRSIDLPGRLKAFRVYEGVLLRADVPGRKKEKFIRNTDLYEKKKDRLGPEADQPADVLPVEALPAEVLPGKEEILLPGWENTVRVPGGQIRARLFSYKGEGIEEKKYTKWMDYDKIRSSLLIRFRKTGDFMTITGSGQHKSLSRVMLDDKIPREERDRCLLAAGEAEVLWIIGGRMSESVKISPETTLVLEIQYQED